MPQLEYYTGNAGLGLGGNSDIPAIAADNNLSILNNTLRTISLLDNEKNAQMFQQKVRDRDQLTQRIMADQVQTGNILPQYQPYFDEAKRGVQKAFQAWRGNQNDTEGFRKYTEAVGHLKDVAAHSQANSAEVAKLRTQIAGEGLPRKQAQMQQWLDGQLNQDFWNPIQPYQQMHDFSIGAILKTPPDKTKIVYDPNDPAKSYTQTYADYDDILRFKKDQFHDDEEDADSIAQFSSKYRRFNQAEMKQDLEAIDRQIDKYNQQRGFKTGDVGFVGHIKRAEVNGIVQIQEPDIEFAAKYALAHKDKYAESALNFNKDIAKNQIDKGKLAIEAKKLGVQAAKAGAYIRHLGALDKNLATKQAANLTPTDVTKTYTDFINNLNPRGVTITSKETGEQRQMGSIFIDELPASYQNIAGPVVNDKGKVTVGTLTPYTTQEGRPYYIPKYVNSQTGEEIHLDSDFLKTKFKEWRKQGLSKQATIDDVLKIMLRTGAAELVMKGKNGASNFSTILQSAKTLNALGTSKGEENIINSPSGVPDTTGNDDDE